ncbi:MAG: DUF480 domain-containing protein [Pirellulales bacterium]|nr:DUF480 domain-containing protein [Pirellulales bacterium]
MNEQSDPQASQPKPRWQPLSAIDRRVAGVLVEKAKTTPSAYPMSLNAVVTAANQKSNRDPVMQIEPEDAEESLQRLRHLGAVGLVEGYGRVVKYRHYLYEWLGVEKVELAVMAELLLRGPQTEGELRGRASRMEPIADLPALRPVLESLKSKGLVLPLTPEGRGHMITHALYSAGELDRIRSQMAAVRPVPTATGESADKAENLGGGRMAAPGTGLVESLRGEIEQLRTDLSEIRSELADLTAAMERTDTAVRRLKEDLGV